LKLSDLPSHNAAPIPQIASTDAVRLLEVLGTAPQRLDITKPEAIELTGVQYLSRLMAILHPITAPEFDKCFIITVVGSEHQCSFVFNNENWGTVRNTDKTLAKHEAAKTAINTAMQHISHYKKFLLKVPSSMDAAPTAALLQFLSSYSIYKHGDELQGVYKSFIQQPSSSKNDSSQTIAPNLSGTIVPYFECRLQFRGVDLELGKGDSKRRAREDASRRVLRKLQMVLQALDLRSCANLNSSFGPGRTINRANTVPLNY